MTSGKEYRKTCFPFAVQRFGDLGFNLEACYGTRWSYVSKTWFAIIGLLPFAEDYLFVAP